MHLIVCMHKRKFPFDFHAVRKDIEKKTQDKKENTLSVLGRTCRIIFKCTAISPSLPPCYLLRTTVQVVKVQFHAC